MAQVLRRRGRIQVKVDKREREALIGIIDSLSPVSPHHWLGAARL